MNFMKELRGKSVSARIKPSAKRIIANSKYNYADAIEYFAFNIVNKNEDKIMRLKHLKSENKRYENKIKLNQMEIEDIAQELGINPEDDLLYAEDIKKAIKSILNWYSREKSTYRSLEDFLLMKEKKINNMYVSELNIDFDELKERVISKYNEKNKDNQK